MYIHYVMAHEWRPQVPDPLHVCTRYVQAKRKQLSYQQPQSDADQAWANFFTVRPTTALQKQPIEQTEQETDPVDETGTKTADEPVFEPDAE